NYSLDEDSRVMKLECRYDVVWNPLLIGILTFLLLILTLLVIWFTLLRNKFYPKIRGIRNIQVISPYFRSYTIARKTNIVFSSINANQNKLTKIFKGETIFAVNEVWEKPFIVFPGKRKGQLKYKLPNGYTIVSVQTKTMPRHLERFGNYEIKTDKNETIKL